MLTLIVVGLVGGIVTSISPCVLPVLPVILAAASSGRDQPGAARSRRPVGVVAGLVVSFSLATLLGSIVLSALHLPQDLLRNAGIVVLVLIGVSLIVPRLGDLIEKPFAWIPKRNVNPNSNGVVLGLGLGLLFVPCAGPVLATIAVVGATHNIGFGAIALTAAFGVGVGIPLLVLALAGDALARRTGIVRRRARELRAASGLVMVLLGIAIGLNLTDGLQRHVPGYTSALQKHFENNDHLQDLVRTGSTTGPGRVQAQDSGASRSQSSQSTQSTQCREGASNLVDCNAAPEFTGINGWLNTPGNQPLSLAGLRGKVVLVDFWTYSCINCQRTLPYLESWYRKYHASGLEIVGVHTPEFAFEHVTSNIREQAAALGVQYPIAIDNHYETWNAYGNLYWPAEYLVDAEGNVRHIAFGEGGYADTENLIRQLLDQASPGSDLGARPAKDPTQTRLADQTPETYLGSHYQIRVSGTPLAKGRTATYSFPATLTKDTFALDGTWTSGQESVTAGQDAHLRLDYKAHKAFLVLGGNGTVTVHALGAVPRTITVSGVPRLYTVANLGDAQRRQLTLDVSPGVQAYDFTYG